jgi:hypothetical protein
MSTFILAFILIVGGIFVGYTFVWTPLQAKEATITTLEKDIAERQQKIMAIQKRKPDMERWAKESLPAESDYKYFNTLLQLVRSANFPNTPAPSVTSKGADAKAALYPSKKPIYTKLQYQIVAKGDMATLVDFMERFYKLPLLHQIREVTITRAPVTSGGGGRGGQNAQQQKDLDIHLTIEALVLDIAEKRSEVEPSAEDVKSKPPVLAVEVPVAEGEEKRNYAQLSGKDLFYGAYREQRGRGQGNGGPPPFDIQPYMHVTAIVGTGDDTVITLFDRYQGRYHNFTPRGGSGQMQTFWYFQGNKRPFGGQSKQLSLTEDLAGGKARTLQIAHVSSDGLVFQDAGDKKYYKLMLGQALADMKEASKEELDALGIKPAEPAAPAAPAEGEKK